MSAGAAPLTGQCALIPGILSYWQAVSPRTAQGAPGPRRKKRRRTRAKRRRPPPGATHMRSRRTNA